MMNSACLVGRERYTQVRLIAKLGYPFGTQVRNRMVLKGQGEESKNNAVEILVGRWDKGWISIGGAGIFI